MTDLDAYTDGELQQALARVLAQARGEVLNDAEVQKFWQLYKEIQRRGLSVTPASLTDLAQAGINLRIGCASWRSIFCLRMGSDMVMESITLSHQQSCPSRYRVMAYAAHFQIRSSRLLDNPLPMCDPPK